MAKMIYKKLMVNERRQKVKLQLVSNQYFVVTPIGDVHYGVQGFPTDRFRDQINWAMDRGAYFLGMGDYIDFAPYSQRVMLAPLRDETKMQIDDMIKAQVDEFIEIVKPTKRRWLGLLEGNHRYDFADGSSVDQYICSKLGADFLGTSALLYIVPPDIDFARKNPESGLKIYAHHGIGSSRMAGGHLHRVEDLLAWIDADIYLMGHSHAKISTGIDQQIITWDGKHAYRTKYMARTGGFLRAYLSHEPLALNEPAFLSRGSYVERNAYMPSQLGALTFCVGYERIDGSIYYKPTIACAN